MHLIKWQWQPQKQSKSWATTIRNQRLDLKYLLKDSPSLKRLIPEMLPDAWDSAADEAAFETDLPISTFPESCSWDIDTQNWAICRSGFWDHQTEWCILSIFRKIISLRLWVTATPENIVEV
ncbi:DUF29 domain-containing protein [Acidithiobacillus thiooxidans]|uniref:DUF29 domain-containing protein n=1 Tax=Acidithiobacillus thiooxidans TaxID=930 RepID=UPI00285B499C|nr:DUF29 domain-containing protein [Acidithiobacillus thiooxidans]MDR7927138.1 DUF29 domain-containing protein [Acidithiobacillus thiooxidans]